MRTSHLRQAPLALLTVLSLLAVSGCWKGGAADRGGPAGQVAWQAQPTAIRVYPSSRFAVQGGRPILEARIEFRDEMDDSIKAVGQLHLELFTQGEHRGEMKRLYTWDVPMTTVDQQRQYYDRITRAYLFRLSMDAPPPAEGVLVLQAMYVPLQGPRLEAEAEIER